MKHSYSHTHTKKKHPYLQKCKIPPLSVHLRKLSIWLLAVVATCKKLTCKWSFLSRREGLPSGSYHTVTRRLIFACTNAACSGLRSSDYLWAYLRPVTWGSGNTPRCFIILWTADRSSSWQLAAAEFFACCESITAKEVDTRVSWFLGAKRIGVGIQDI